MKQLSPLMIKMPGEKKDMMFNRFVFIYIHILNILKQRIYFRFMAVP